MHHYSIQYVVDDTYEHTTQVLYGSDIDLRKAPTICGTLVALFESLKFMILFPDEIDAQCLGAMPPSLIEEFRKMIPLLWNQHMHENGRTGWQGPRVAFQEVREDSGKQSFAIDAEPPEDRAVLLFNGGGKDSLLASHCLEQIGVPYGTLGHSRTEYGRHSDQHRHQDLLAHAMSGSMRNHHIRVFDTITDGEFVRTYYPHIQGECAMGRPCQVGTPEMLFYAIPYALQYDYTHMALGWEKSSSSNQALAGQEYVNHQWLKSLDAERAYNRVLGASTKGRLQVFSPIRGFSDRLLFQLLVPPRLQCRIHLCHSCNVAKPWCFKCPKCLYVWLHYLAVFPPKTMRLVFGQHHLGDAGANENVVLRHADIFRHILGMEDRLAFECVGEALPTCQALVECINKSRLDKHRLPNDMVVHAFRAAGRGECGVAIEDIVADIHPDFREDMRRVVPRMINDAQDLSSRIMI